ncbi:hypothetical protein GE061_014867 [Apolygus lucorum]|uniref:Uncharacterized protein n=1 Tax=Apolygus lucorum TaxID=248454 RepID=A0A6A4J370_APOLU|nr:hypothetical protein GE061_014867 [Apolygus lucorum]
MVDVDIWEECALRTFDGEECTGFPQYVNEVIDFSSQYGSDISISYTAYNITGKPSKYPDYGDFPQAFVMRTYGKWWYDAPSRPEPIMTQNFGIQSQDYIDVSFEQKVYPEQVTLYETYNPGSVVRIWAGDGSGKWKLLWEGEPQLVGHGSRKFSPVINQIDFMTNLLRVEFNHSKLDYYTELDAILLVGSHCNNAAKASNNIQKDLCKIASQIKALNIDVVSDYMDMTTTLYSLTSLAQQYSSMLDDINQEIELSSRTTSGPFDSLPDETVLRILSNLDLVSLCRCTKVNKHFYRLASDAMLHTAINLKPYWHSVNYKTLEYLSPRCKYLQKIDLSWCGNYGQISPMQFISFIEKCGKQINNLRLDCCKFINDDCVKQIAVSCRNLKELSIRNCLKISREGFESLASISTFQRLDFYRTGIEADPLVKLLEQNPNLQHINLGSCVSLSSMDTVAQCLGAHNHELVSVDFWKTYSLTPLGVKALANCSKLEEVDLGWCLGVSIPGECMMALATGCRKLRKLFLAALRGITDRDLAPFMENCPHLQQVDLLGVRSITPFLCLRFLETMKELQLFDISFCDQIQDEVVQEWRRCFPKVSIKRSSQSDGIPSPFQHY